MALKCPFLTKLPMTMIKSHPGAVLKFADACPFASTKLNLSLFRSLSQGSDGQDGSANRSGLEKITKMKNQSGFHTTTSNLDSTSNSVIQSKFDHGDILMMNMPLSESRSTKEAASKCPFLKENNMAVTEASEGLKDDIIIVGDKDTTKSKSADSNSFNYEKFCQGEIEKKKQEGTYRVFPKIDRKAMQFPYAEDKMKESDITVWCSNDYLGMSRHPKVMGAVHDAVERYGVGAGGTRNIGGNSSLHDALEFDLAKLHGKERALLFSSCFIANDTALETLGAKLPGCHIFSDSGNHASMIKGIRNSRAPKHIFRHNDPAHLEELLSSVDKKVPKIVAFETVHSMTGAVCPLKEMIQVSKRHGAITFVDEVHAVGLYGKHGAGIAEREGLMDEVDIFSGTLGKAYGNVGGYIAGSDAVIDLVRSFGSGFIFTTSLPPHVLAGARESIRILASEEGRALRRRHQDTVKVLRQKMVDEGLPVIHCPSHIIPVHVGDPNQSIKAMHDLRNRWSIYIQAINYPTVKFGEERLRVAPTPFHDQDMIKYFIKAIKDVWTRNGLQFKSMCTISCEFCKEPLKFESLSSREYPCDGSRCCTLLATGMDRTACARVA